MSYPFCNEHVTVLVFTGKTWCGNCMAIADQLDTMHRDAAQSNDYHFAQLDDSDPNMLPLFRAFGIAGVPMFLIHDPQASGPNRLIAYDGNRIAKEIIDCVRNRTCTGRMHNANISMRLVPHGAIQRDPEQQQRQPQSNPESKTNHDDIIDVCPDHPVYIVFTSETCPACRDAKPDMERLKQRYGAHMLHYDANQDTKKFEALNLEYIPAFLHYEPRTQTLRKVSRAHLDQDDLKNQPIWPVRSGILRNRACPAAETVTMSGECPTISMSGECPTITMAGECPTMSGECPAMSGECPAMNAQPFDAAVFNPRALSQTRPGESIIEAMVPLALKEAICDANVIVDVCRACPTFFVFTGTNWCTECQMFVPELIKLKQTARCGLYHVNHFDTQIGLDDFNRRVCRAFQVERFPTVLLFDPKSFSFVAYNSLLRYKDLKLAPELLGRRGPNQLPQLPVPRDVSFRVSQPSPNVLTPIMRMRLCADCPTVLIFAVHLDKYENAIKQNGNGMHVIGFPASDLESRNVYDAFKINTVPKVLIYNPHMGNFYVFDGAHKDVPTTAAAAYKHVKSRVWRDIPTIVMQR